MEKHVSIDNIRINYFEKGNGFPLVLVHGMGSSIVWDSVIDELSSHSRVIAIDLPGFGKSDKPDTQYTISYYVDILHKFIKILGLNKINLAGLSLGGLIVSEFTYSYSEVVEKLIIISSAGLKPVASYIRFPIIYPLISIFMKLFIFSNRKSLRKYQESSYFNKNKIPDWVFNKYYELMQYPKAQSGYLNALKLVTVKDNNFPGRVSKINNETLIIWGENDPTFSIEYAKEFNRLINKSILKILPECGHTVTIEDPKGFCKYVTEFLW